MRALSDVRASLSLDPERGLSSAGAQESRKRFGENRLTPLPHEPLWKKFLEKFDEPIIKILLGAALLSMFVELFRGDPDKVPPVAGNPMLAGNIVLGFGPEATYMYGASSNNFRNLILKAGLQGPHHRLDQTLLLRGLADTLRGPNQLGSFASDALMKLGLLGTIIGFILM